MVSVAELTVSPVAVPVTLTVSFSSSSSSSVGAKLKSALPDVAPEAIVTVKDGTAEKSLLSAEFPATETVTSVADSDVPPASVAVTVTITESSPSITESGTRDRFTALGPELSPPPSPFPSPGEQPAMSAMVTKQGTAIPQASCPGCRRRVVLAR